MEKRGCKPQKNEFKRKLTERADKLERKLFGCHKRLDLAQEHLKEKKAEILGLKNSRQPLVNRVRILNKQIESLATEHKALKFLYNYACLRNEELLVWLKRATEAEGAEEIKEFMEAGVILREEIAKEDKLRERTNKKAGISAPAVAVDEGDRTTDPETADGDGADDGELCREAEDESSPCVED